MKSRLKEITVSEAMKVRDYLENENQHTDSVLITCYITYTSKEDMIASMLLQDVIEVLDQVEERHTKQGSISKVDQTIRQAIWSQAIFDRSDTIKDDDMCTIPVDLYIEYLESDYKPVENPF